MSWTARSRRRPSSGRIRHDAPVGRGARRRAPAHALAVAVARARGAGGPRLDRPTRAAARGGGARPSAARCGGGDRRRHRGRRRGGHLPRHSRSRARRRRLRRRRSRPLRLAACPPLPDHACATRPLARRLRPPHRLGAGRDVAAGRRVGSRRVGTERAAAGVRRVRPRSRGIRSLRFECAAAEGRARRSGRRSHHRDAPDGPAGRRHGADAGAPRAGDVGAGGRDAAVRGRGAPVLDPRCRSAGRGRSVGDPRRCWRSAPREPRPMRARRAWP